MFSVYHVYKRIAITVPNKKHLFLQITLFFVAIPETKAYIFR